MDSGGYGPGSYYVPVMVQFVFLFPLIEKIVYRYRFAGVVFFGGCNLLYEILQRLYGMGESCYRLLIFRYLLLIAYGCWLAVDRQIKYGFLSCAVAWVFLLSC